MPTPTASAPWAALHTHRDAIRTAHLRDLFKNDPQRAERFSLQHGGLLLDFSKNRLTEETCALLTQLAEACDLQGWIERMFQGAQVNVTEQRAVLHTALRSFGDTPVMVGGENVLPKIEAVRQRMRTFVDAVRSGQWRGYTDAPITDVVNFGIGGSDLGPAMATRALAPYAKDGPRVHFVSNVDGTHLSETWKRIRPDTTLFIVSSKSFTTPETLTNARSARRLFLEHGAPESAIAKHFAAVSTNLEATAEFGIASDNVFGFWDWVGGRYSLWSAIGLPLALAIGMDAFEDFLRGAEGMDQHFRHTPLRQNMPVMMGLLGVWYHNFFDAPSYAIIPYDQSLEHFPAYVQQLDMESNGKSVGRDGARLDHTSGPLVWGAPGTNGQHAFFQLLHQGTHLVPIDFIAPVQPQHELHAHHDMLLANLLAQSEALMCGQSAQEARAELEAQGLSGGEVAALLPHKVFEGNRPSNTLLLDKLTPSTLGALIALYEHRVFVQGIVWNINSFDQWGVELGKKLARTLLEDIQGGKAKPHDASTEKLLEHIKAGRRQPHVLRRAS